jgi:pyruvate dehydrogenase phosphatase
MTNCCISVGHCGHDTVNYVHKRLPSMVKMSLQALLQSTPTTSLKPELVSEALCNTVRHLDESMRSHLFDFLPHDHLTKMSDTQLNRLISQRYSEWNAISARCTQGSTALLALSDPLKKNVWILNLGDSIAGKNTTLLMLHPLSDTISVLGERSLSGKWTAVIVNSMHNGNNPTEYQRIRREHPSESACMTDNRVVGYLAPTRGKPCKCFMSHILRFCSARGHMAQGSFGVHSPCFRATLARLVTTTSGGRVR